MNKLFQVMGALVLLLGLMVGCGGATPAVFMLSDLDVPAAEVNSTVTIGVTVANEGEEAGDCDVNLTVGNYTDSKPVTLEGGASTLVSFSYDTTVEGSYPVSVATLDDTEAGTLTVTAEAENGEPVNGDEDGVIPTASVGDQWIYVINYEDPVGTPKYDQVLFNTELMELDVAFEQETLDENGAVTGSVTTQAYRAHIDIVPDSTRDVILPMEVTATISELDIWVCAETTDFLRQLAYSHVESPLPSDSKTYIDYLYSGAHGWPYTVGSTWDYTVQQITREAPVAFSPSFIDKSVEVVGVEDVTVAIYELSDIDLTTGALTGTGTDTTFSCKHVKHFEDGVLAYEEWVAVEEIGTAVKMVDHAQYIGTETRLLVYSSI